jgi:hypothetical protein
MAGSMSVRSRGVALAAALVVAVAGSGACDRSGYQFVRNRSTGTYLKVPDTWTVHSQKVIEDALAESDPGGERTPYPFISVFDAKPHSDFDFDIATDRPVGVVRVRPLSAGERDSVSFASAREEFLETLNADIESGALPVKKALDIEQDAADGQRIVFSFTDEESGITSVIDQTTLIDKAKSRIYLLVVGCSASCYQKHHKQIDTVVTSLTIKET